MLPYRMTSADLDQYHRDGYLLVRSLFSAAEVEAVVMAAQADQELMQRAEAFTDANGFSTRASRLNTPGDDIYGRVMRCRRMVDAMEHMLGGEVYHWHSKLMLKEPFVGGAWEWHQDYGYWYQHNFCLYPLMAACSISLDRAVQANGCLRVLRGSHLMGRIDHGRIAGQMGADLERVSQAEQRHELVYMETEPGDAVFFHCNLLHSSGPNRSPMPRWTFICCYNAARNDPYRDSYHPRYVPMNTIEDGAVLAAARNGTAGVVASRFA
jgi:ectoine hydroxylase